VEASLVQTSHAMEYAKTDSSEELMRNVMMLMTLTMTDATLSAILKEDGLAQDNHQYVLRLAEMAIE
jgi:hypothetical protein